jgi:hypothetical protein
MIRRSLIVAALLAAIAVLAKVAVEARRRRGSGDADVLDFTTPPFTSDPDGAVAAADVAPVPS